ncbi:MBL fold metallo-hydrolase [Microbaculum marinum]|uniref:MBL fold metallo-hydrolase n=1 Tax=Microbaculum marinum TaxID=1764581 RepID=A0AAW9RTS6_9HYPH
MKLLRNGSDFAAYRLGRLTVVALRDGYVDMAPSRLRRDDDRPFGPDLPEPVKAALVEGQLRLSVNAFLIAGNGRHILIDTGAANAWDPSMGRLPAALAEAGVAPADIDTVAFTHTHLDHVSGLVAAEGTDMFPNLEHLYVPLNELPLFHRKERLARFRERAEGFDGGFALSDNVTAIAAHGHEVGHSAFEVSDAGETLLVWGDIVHVPSIQFAQPELTWELDADQAQARASRETLLRRATENGTFVAGAHLDFPGVGRVATSGNGYRFIPL